MFPKKLMKNMVAPALDVLRKSQDTGPSDLIVRMMVCDDLEKRGKTSFKKP
jgi:hypothetical protein